MTGTWEQAEGGKGGDSKSWDMAANSGTQRRAARQSSEDGR